MNTYKIIFTRENGTQGTDHFTAINERQARKDFGECYSHSTATIISIDNHFPLVCNEPFSESNIFLHELFISDFFIG